MVPFTWWVVSATLSVSSYMTGLVLRMPADIITQNSTKEKAKVNMATNCTLNFNVDATSKKIWYCDKYADVDLAEFFLKWDGAYGIIPMYAYNIFKFNELDTFKNTLNSTGTLAQANALIAWDTAYTTWDSATKNAMLQAAIIATSIGKIGVQLLMSVIFAVVFVVILIALVLVLFTRVIKMWMYTIFSPLFALKFFLDEKVKQESALGAFKFGDFIALAMVPVVVSAALGFGFMFIMTFKTQMEQPIEKWATQKWIDSPFITVDKNSTGTGGNIQFFGTTINIKLSDTNSNGVGANGQPVKADDLKVALFNVLSGLITPIFGIVILWMAVMAAIKTSAVAGKAIEGIEGLGKLAGDMGKKIPGMLPVPGASYVKDGKKQNVNFKQLTMAPWLIKGWADAKESEERQGMQQWMGLDKGIKELAAQIANLNPEKASKLYGESIAWKRIDELAKNETERDNLQAMLKKFNITLSWDELTKFNAWNKEAFAKAFKDLVSKMQTSQLLTDANQKTKLGQLSATLSGTNITPEQLKEFNTIMGWGDSDSGWNTGPTHKDIDIHFDNNTFKNTKKITVSNAQTGGTPTDVTLWSNLTNRSSLDEIKADIKSKLNAENIHMDEAELIKLANRIKTELPPPATP